jgi:hypothetical protein
MGSSSGQEQKIGDMKCTWKCLMRKHHLLEFPTNKSISHLIYGYRYRDQCKPNRIIVSILIPTSRANDTVIDAMKHNHGTILPPYGTSNFSTYRA